MNNSPLVSIVLPAFNEAAILRDHLDILVRYLETELTDYRWEIVIVNDGSSDDTGEIAEAFAAERDNVIVVHHKRNFGLGRALRSGMSQTQGDYVVTMDIDLSYAPDHIRRLVEKLQTSGNKLILASPYMRDGKISNVPWLRKFLSINANRFLSMMAPGDISTLTCMVRGYEGPFCRSLVLRATGMEIMPEEIYKSMIVRAGVGQVPAHLDWGLQNKQIRRASSMRIPRHMFSTLLSGFVFRPFMFFILPGLLLLAFAGWVNVWMVIHFFDALGSAPADVDDTISWAISTAYQEHPHTFIVGLLSLMLAVQLVSLGILALQSKSYFEEIFYLGSTVGKRVRDGDRVDK